VDVHAALEEVSRWAAQQTLARNPERIEVDCHGVVTITIGESSPPWHVRLQRRSSAGASSPVAQLRYDPERRSWALHYGQGGAGWCTDEDAIHAGHIADLLAFVENDRSGRFEGLPPSFWR
jgi:hypothetical protein